MKSLGPKKAGELVRDLGLALPAEDPAPELTLSQLAQFTEEAARRSGDDLFGLNVAQANPRGLYGLLEFACRTAPTVGEAMARLERYIALLNVVVRFRMQKVKHELLLIHDTPGQREALGRHGNEFVIALLLEVGRQISPQLKATRIWFAHTRPDCAEDVEARLGAPVDWGLSANGIAYPAESSDIPIATSEPALLKVLDAYAQEQLRRSSGDSLLDGLRAHFGTVLEQGPPKLTAAARQFRVSPRTLQRQLAERGTSFAQLLDGYRNELARVLVVSPHLSAGEVAFLLGYSELSAFIKAFKRWTGQTPKSFRANEG